MVRKVLLLDPSVAEQAALLSSEFRSLARLVHPDKNRHPLSKEAFQKASELFKGS